MKGKVKRLKNKKVETYSKEDFFEVLNTIIAKLILYIVLGFIVFITAKFFWWIGFVLYIILMAYMLSEFLVNGLILFLGGFVFAAYLSLILKTKQIKFDKDIHYSLLVSLLFGIFCLFLFVIEGLLFVFLFPDLF